MAITKEKKREYEMLCLARMIAMLNSEFIYFMKNKLLNLDNLKLKELKSKHEKMTLRIQSECPNAKVSLILANPDNNKNHDLTKIDVDLIKNELIESFDREDKNDDIGN